jgi:DNA primase
MNVLELLRSAGIEPKKVGKRYQSACPICGGSTRFGVWPDDNGGSGSYYCFGCGKSGDNIQFLIDVQHLSFSEACQQLGRPIPAARSLKAPAASRGKKEFIPADPGDPCDTWLQKASQFVSWAHEQLMKRRPRLDWLAERGISAETAARYKIGWNPGEKGGDIYRPRESWGLPPETKEDGKPRRLWLPVGLTIPNFTGGTCTRIRIRRPDPITFGPRYYVVPGSSMATMVLPPRSLDDGDVFSWSVFVVVEAELDAVAIWQAAGDISGAVALGSVSTRPDKAASEQLDACNLILNALDFDEAGAATAWTWWPEVFQHCERWPVPEGKDPGDAYKAGVDLKLWVMAALPDYTRAGSRKDQPQDVVVPSEAPGTTTSCGVPDTGTINNPDDPGLSPAAAMLPPGVLELFHLLKTAPARIKKTGNNIDLRIDPAWEKDNWEAAKGISDLVFMDPEVGLYLDRHPASSITFENFLGVK